MTLIEKLMRVGIPAEVSPYAFVLENDAMHVFGMSIRNRAQDPHFESERAVSQDDEYIAFWPGDARVRLSDASKKHAQAVLHVQEASRTYRQVWVFDGPEDLHSRLAQANGRLLHMDRHLAQVELTTPSHWRAFLIGRDETHLFICQLPEMVESVADAHAALRPPEARKPGTRRQGEWFCVPSSRAEQRTLDAFAAREPAGIQRESPLADSTWGTPHVVEELVPAHATPLRTPFARGVLKQAPRHSPLDLGNRWHRIVRNREVPQPLGMRWID